MDYEKIILDWKAFKLPNVVSRDYEIDLNLDLITTISGPRRSGKTYFCFQIMNYLLGHKKLKNNVLYINFEDEKLIGANADDLNKLFYTYLEMFDINLDDKIYLFLDEIQNVSH